jgi:hypothetical protein
MAEQSMTPLKELEQYVKPGSWGAPPKVITDKIIEGAAKFLKETMLWTYDMEDFPVRTDVHTYAVITPQDTLPSRVKDAFWQAPGDTDFRPLYPKTEDSLDQQTVLGQDERHFFMWLGNRNWKTLQGAPKFYTHEDDPGLVRLIPIPTSNEADGLVRLKVAIFPGRKATQIPTWILERYYLAIAEAAKYCLLTMPGEQFSNDKSAAMALEKYKQYLTQAKIDKARSFTKAPMRVEPRHPII